MHSAAQRNAIPEANVRKTVAKADGEQSQTFHFRLYAPEECTGQGGYPEAWHETLKHEVREQAGHRCIRCLHPYRKGDGEWSRCDERCVHGDPFRWHYLGETYERTKDGPDDFAYDKLGFEPFVQALLSRDGCVVEARYRILTVHHLDGNKGNCRWWNLAALCQRCHLQIQGKVKMERRWLHEHSDWFKPYVAGYYAHVYLSEDLTREETEARLDELLALEDRQLDLAPASVPCPRCERGTIKRRTGDMWWQVQHLRCSWCRGTGRIRPTTEGDS